jgi:hypothetical protein
VVTGFLAEKGSPAPWVGVEWDHAGTMVTVRCSHCGVREGNYTTELRRDPEWIARTVAEHNRHVDSPADDKRPWVPGTP